MHKPLIKFLNLLRLHQLISDKGKVYRKWVLPAAYNRNKEAENILADFLGLEKGCSGSHKIRIEN